MTLPLSLFVPRALVATCTLVVLAGCADTPDLMDEDIESLESAAYPTLVPIEQILDAGATDPQTDIQTANRLEARAAALQARARRLQGSGIDPDTRRRLDDGVSTD